MMLPSDKQKILVIQTASIGDVILATPLLEKLHHHFPDSKIDFLLKKGNEKLFSSHPFINRIIIWDKSKKKYKNLWDILKNIRAQKYDAVLNIQRFATSGILTAFSGAELKVGFNKNPFSILFSRQIKHSIKTGQQHEIERNQLLVEEFTDSTPFSIKLYPSKADYARMSQYKTKAYITISPASLWFTKQFPAEKWINFLSQIDPELYVYFLGAKNDMKICEDIIQGSGHKNSLNLSGKLSFLESAALMKDAKMNYMNDSAPLHLASSVNARTTAIFCSTVSAFGFGPLSDDAIIVETRETLDCRPCGLHGFNECPKTHFRCALTIDEKELLNRLET